MNLKKRRNTELPDLLKTLTSASLPVKRQAGRKRRIRLVQEPYHKESSMFCLRCGGMMVVERFQDIRDRTGQGSEVLRCVLCGELLDPVIILNRSRGGAPARRWRPKLVRA